MPRPYQCSYCASDFLTVGELVDHNRTHNAKFRDCYSCGPPPPVRFNLRRHFASMETAFKCDHCDYACATAKKLLLHKRAH